MLISKKLGLALLLCMFFVALTLCDRPPRSKKKNSKEPRAPYWKRRSPPKRGENSIDITEKRQLTLECPAHGHPKPNITWTKNGVDINNIPNMKAKTHKYSFIIQSAKSRDSGNYTCTLTNEHGALNFTFTVEVSHPKMPFEVIPPKNVTVSVGLSATFVCQVKSEHAVKIQWLHKNLMNSMRGKKAKFLPTGPNPEVLQIQNVTYDNAGKYTCLAGNTHNLKYVDAWLTVVPRQHNFIRKTMPPLIVSTWKVPLSRNPNAEMEKKHANETDLQTREAYPALVGIWTIYIIVGSVSGGVLLIGLITIIVAVCCRRESTGTYKSTNV